MQQRARNFEGRMSKPAYNAYIIREFEKDGKRCRCWTKIGVVFPHKDAEGYDVALEDGRVTTPDPKDAPKILR
jgi:hypothetical protein